MRNGFRLHAGPKDSRREWHRRCAELNEINHKLGAISEAVRRDMGVVRVFCSWKWWFCPWLALALIKTVARQYDEVRIVAESAEKNSCVAPTSSSVSSKDTSGTSG